MNERQKLNDYLKFAKLTVPAHLPGESGWVDETMGEQPQDELEEEEQIQESISIPGNIEDQPVTREQLEAVLKQFHDVIGGSVSIEQNGTPVLVMDGNGTPVQWVPDGQQTRIINNPPVESQQGTAWEPPPSVVVNAPRARRLVKLSKEMLHRIVFVPVREEELRGFDHVQQNLINLFVDQWMKGMSLEPFVDNILAEDEIGRQLIDQLLTELWLSNDNGDGTSNTPEIFLKAAKFRLMERVKVLANNH